MASAPEGSVTGGSHTVPEAWLPGTGRGPIGIPRVVKLVCNAALAEKTGGICLVLPEATGVEQLAAVMCALSYLPGDSSALAGEQVRKTFQPGQKVRVLPDGFVYRVAGSLSYDGKEGYFLQYLDAKKGSGNGRFGIWGEDLRRLEPTERSRPLGPDRHQWSMPVLTTIDRICGTRTIGNHALLKNRVTVLGGRADLEEFLNQLTLLPAPDSVSEMTAPIGGEFPWGSISENGTVYIEHPRSTPGEPLIAATRSFVAAHAASDSADIGSKLFVSRWLEGCIQNFQNLSKIADRQRVLLLVDASERDRLGLFRKDGWTVWELSAAELLGPDQPAKTGLRCLDRNIVAAKRDRGSRAIFRTASSEHLSACYGVLRSLGQLIGASRSDDGDFPDEDVEEQASLLWGLFLQASGWIVAPDEEEKSEFVNAIGEARLHLAGLAVTVSPETLQPMRDALNAMKAFAAEFAAGATTQKGDVLLEALEARNPGFLVVGGTRDREHARAHLAGILPAEQIVSVAELRGLDVTGMLVACSLMARRAFSRLVDPCPAEAIEFVGYDFEVEIYRGRLAWRSKARDRLLPDKVVREQLGGFPAPREEVRPAGTEPAARPVENSIENPIETIAATSRKPRYELPKSATAEADETREGRLCRFTGCSWAIFTPGHSITVLGKEANGLQRKGADDLATGDHILLRESGDKDVIRLVAEDIGGASVYAELWDRAQRWKEALKAISSNPLGLWSKLGRLGLHRDPLTIRYWLLEDGVIGPRSQDDISIIVEGAGGKPEDSKWTECWDAVCRLRSLHMRAGMRLTDILEAECRDLACEDFEYEQALQLSLGLLWLVRVSEIQPESHWPSSDLNHLTWGNYDWREQRLRSALNGELA